jgi:hypothetical protein
MWMILLAMGSFATFFTACDDDTMNGIGVENCNNGIDDNGNGLIDCEDPDCENSADCDNVETLPGRITTMTLDASKVYIIDRFTYVDDGQTLTIPAGTILKANTGDGADASALIVARGGTILANGTPDNPIIFTSILDDIEPGEKQSSLSFDSDAGKWGGLIVLGKAPISASLEDGDTETSIEGVPDEFPFGFYGGDQPMDNSGSLKYVSIRFTGTKLATNDEIQGLTLGGVGQQTIIEDIEIISSDDDGVEFFGGNVNVNRMLIVAQTDDGIDIDQSYDGTVNNSMVLQYNPSAGNDANEIDGPEGPSNTGGKFTISNTTYINKSGDSRGARLKSGAQGTLQDCLWVDFNAGIFVSGGSANANYVAGELEVKNCEFQGSGSVIEALISSDDAGSEATIKTLFAGAGNSTTQAPTKGSSADFSWTWTNDLGLLP